MTKPAFMDILGRIVECEYVKNLSNDENIMGDYSDHNNRIRIDKGLTKIDLIHTLIHETFHAYASRLGISDELGKLEEVLADSFATVLVENFDIRLKKMGKPE